MRNPAVSISCFKGTKNVYMAPLTEQEQKMCDLILEGMTYTKAADTVGLWQDLEPKKRQNKCQNFVKTKRAKLYLTEHAKTVKMFVEKDMELVRMHMYEIAMGTARKKCTKVTKDGDIVEYEDTPGFRDQIAAASWLSGDLRDKRNMLERTPSQEIIVNDIEEIDEKTSAFLDKYTYRRVDDRDTKQIKRIENVIDVEEVEDPRIGGEVFRNNVSAEVIRKAMDEEFKDYRIHG